MASTTRLARIQSFPRTVMPYFFTLSQNRLSADWSPEKVPHVRSHRASPTARVRAHPPDAAGSETTATVPYPGRLASRS